MRDRYFKFQIGILVVLVLSILLLFGGVFFWEKIYPLPYRISQPVTQPASTPADTAELTARIENLENDQNFNLKAFEWKLDQKLIILGGVAFLISLAAGIVGIKSYNDLDKVINEEVRRSLDKALYHLDPTNLRIWVVSYDQDVSFRGDAVLDANGKQKRDEKGKPLFEDDVESNVEREMGKVSDRILLTGLLNVKAITQPDKNCFDGVTIVPIFDLDMEKMFRDFLERNQGNLDLSRAAFVLYTRDYFVSQINTLSKYENLATANMPPTVASMVLTVGRGLSNAYPSKKEETK